MSRSLPPGPKNARFLLESPLLAYNVLGYFAWLGRRYPEPLLHLQLGLPETYIVNHPDLVREVLVTNPGAYRRTKGLGDVTLDPLIGEGLLTAEERTWVRQRRIIRPAFRRGHRATVDAYTLEETERVAARWRSTGGPVDVQADAKRLLLRALVRTMLSPDLDPDEQSMIEDLDTVLDYVGMKSYFLREVHRRTLGRLGFAPPSDAEAEAALARLDREIYASILGCRSGTLRAGLLLAPLLEAEAEGRVDLKQIHDEVGTLFLAGFDTTAALVAFTLFELADRPDLQAGIRAEADRAAPEEQPLTQRVLRETLRMYPSVWAINRITAEPVELGGYAIKKGEHVMVLPYAIQRNPAFWEDPNTFHPDRFLNAPDNDALLGLAFLPFGQGRHACIGKHMAMQQAHRIVTQLAAEFTFKRTGPRPRLVPGVIIKAAHGIWLRSTERMPIPA